jgi:hypothetical protein
MKIITENHKYWVFLISTEVGIKSRITFWYYDILTEEIGSFNPESEKVFEIDPRLPNNWKININKEFTKFDLYDQRLNLSLVFEAYYGDNRTKEEIESGKIMIKEIALQSEEELELRNEKKFENNPELYKLWREDPEGFDDYRRGKQASENK